jgi:hypothetical protein
MKATLEFNLPEDQEYYEEASNGTKYSIALFEFDQYLRTQVKYNEQLTDEQYKVYEEVREKFYEIINSNNLSIK